MTRPPPLPLPAQNILDDLASLTLHASPPPTLLSHEAAESSRSNLRNATFDPLHAGDELPERKSGEGYLPGEESDPGSVLQKFITHLTAPEHGDPAPHLIAIGYELEALLSIYPESVKLSRTSRPPSLLPDQLSPPIDLPPAIPSYGNGPASTSAGATQSMTLSSAISSQVSASSSRSDAWRDAVFDESVGLSPTERIRYEVTVPLWEEGDALDGVPQGDVPERAPRMRVLVSLPPSYPSSSPPQLQLLGRYLGPFGIDSGLFGDITRTYISSSGIPFTPGDVCVFEGLQHVLSLARAWYACHLRTSLEAERTRRPEASSSTATSTLASTTAAGATLSTSPPTLPTRPSPTRADFSYTRSTSDDPDTIHSAQKGKMPHFEIHTAEPIIDRKSTFIGHAIRVTDEREVPLVIHEILSDKKVARAAHPAMFAYRIVRDVGGAAGKVVDIDFDDDGESQAGSRLAHLLEILELSNVLVVVSRWSGGILLGPDRFKHINEAARDALELGGFLDEVEKKDARKGRRK